MGRSVPMRYYNQKEKEKKRIYLESPLKRIDNINILIPVLSRLVLSSDLILFAVLTEYAYPSAILTTEEVFREPR